MLADRRLRNGNIKPLGQEIRSLRQISRQLLFEIQKQNLGTHGINTHIQSSKHHLTKHEIELTSSCSAISKGGLPRLSTAGG